MEGGGSQGIRRATVPTHAAAASHAWPTGSAGARWLAATGALALCLSLSLLPGATATTAPPGGAAFNNGALQLTLDAHGNPAWAELAVLGKPVITGPATPTAAWGACHDLATMAGPPGSGVPGGASCLCQGADADCAGLVDRTTS